LFRDVDPGWKALRRSLDFYDEGALVWMRADTIIREKSQDRLSLDDFLHNFFGQKDTGPIVVPYTREDVETSLSAISPYNWHSFFESRIYQVNRKPPTDGLEAAGWKVVFTDRPNSFFVAWSPDEYDASLSIGIPRIHVLDDFLRDRGTLRRNHAQLVEAGDEL
jgi:predicted metalloprotease with PDZ domain